MDPATRFWQIGQRQLALQEGLDLLRQAELELLRDMAGADRWAFVALAAHACQVPLNVVVGGLQLGALRPVFDGFGHALRAAVTALSGEERSLGPAEVEAALLDRAGTRRCFRRVTDDEVASALA